MSDQIHKIIRKLESETGNKLENFDESHYAMLNIVSNDAYLTYEDWTGENRVFSGVIYGQRSSSKDGLVQLIIAQELLPKNKRGRWKRFVFTHKDQNASIGNYFDRIPRKSVDSSANNRIYQYGLSLLTGFVFLLLGIIIFNVELETTFMFFWGIGGILLSIAVFFFYERVLQDKDMVDSGTIYDKFPALHLTRSYIHPVNYDIKRFSGLVPVVGIKSRKVPFSVIMGYSIPQMSQSVEYAQKLENFRREIAEIENEKYEKLKSANGNKAIIDQEFDNKIEIKKQEYEEELFKKHSEIIDTGALVNIISDVQGRMKKDVFRLRVKDYIATSKKESENVHAELVRSNIDRDSYKKDAEAWEKHANDTLNKQGRIMAIQLATILNRKATFDSYESPDLPNYNSDEAGTNIKSGLISLLPVLVIGWIFIWIGNTIGDAIARMGDFALFVFVLFAIIVLGLVLWFSFTWIKSYISDKANRVDETAKVIHT